MAPIVARPTDTARGNGPPSPGDGGGVTPGPEPGALLLSYTS
ncbi:hypothetical protein ACFC4M_22860 [Streptomyces sp. NPDC056019]